MIMITPLAGVTTLRPGSATRPFPGIAAEIRTEKGEKIEVGGGLLALLTISTRFRPRRLA